MNQQNVPPCDSEANDYTFHAKPAPKFETPSLDRKQILPMTVPQTPKFSEAGKASLHSWRERRQRSRVGFIMYKLYDLDSVVGVDDIENLFNFI